MDVENQVRKNLINFCKTLPSHVDCWRSVLQDAAKPLQNLTHLCEQRRHVSNAKMETYEDTDTQSTLLYQISNLAEEDLAALKELIDKLNKSNNDLKNKLLLFERSTVSLDWDEDSELIRGGATQPPLSRLLQHALEFSNFFFNNARNINKCFKGLNTDDEKSVGEFQASFDVNLDDEVVGGLIALTQYVDNVKAII